MSQTVEYFIEVMLFHLTFELDIFAHMVMVVP